MKSKTFIILLAVFVVCGVSAYFILNNDGGGAPKSRLGDLLIDDLPLGDIKEIKIISKGDTDNNEVVLGLKEKGNGGLEWVVVNRFDYPTEFSKVQELVDKMKALKIGHLFEAGEASLKRLSLYPPDDSDKDAAGVRVTLSDGSGKALTDIIIGKERETEKGVKGQYVTFAGDKNIYMVDKHFKYLEKTPSEWLKTDLLDVKADDVQKIVVYDKENGSRLFVLSRPEKNADPVYEDFPEDKEMDKDAVKKVFKALSYLNLIDVASKGTADEKTGFDNAPFFEFHLFDGGIYYVAAGNKAENEDEGNFLKITAAYTPPTVSEQTEKSENTTDDNEENTKKSPDPEEMKSKMESLNKTLSSWYYIVASHNKENFVSDPSDFIKKEEPKENTKENIGG